MVNKIPSLLALFAAAVVTIVSIIQQIPFFDLCLRLIIVIIIFYILGFITSIIINKFFIQEETIDTSSEFVDYDEHDSADEEQPDDSEE